MINNYDDIASIYAKDNNDGTAFLAFKYIHDYIKQHAKGRKSLDYGCGSGLSTRFLKNLGLDTTGVDISPSMLNEAESKNDKIKYQLIESGVLPFFDQEFDIVFSSFVLLEVSSKKELEKILNEIYRVLKKNAIFIAVTGSENLYRYPWLSLDVDFPENRNLKSGDIARVRLKDIDLVVNDFYWTDEDYSDVINNTNFVLLEKNYPLGEDSDRYDWISEKFISPYVIYILKVDGF